MAPTLSCTSDLEEERVSLQCLQQFRARNAGQCGAQPWGSQGRTPVCSILTFITGYLPLEKERNAPHPQLGARKAGL